MICLLIVLASRPDAGKINSAFHCPPQDDMYVSLIKEFNAWQLYAIMAL
jgi:hypothetical protein